MPFETEPVEDSMVRHDWTHLTGWAPTRNSRLDTRTYISPDKTQGLTILHANKISLETATGADLIYIDDIRNATVLIQYKRLGERDAANIAGYRSDDQLDKELNRLQAVENYFTQLPKSDHSDAFRLHVHPCFVKLCFPKIKIDCGPEPIPGMVLPLDYFNRKYRDIKASNTGNSAVFTKEKIGRYLNSTQTIELIKGGWIGTQSEIYAGFALKSYINHALTERSVMLAAKRRLKRRNASQESLF